MNCTNTTQHQALSKDYTYSQHKFSVTYHVITTASNNDPTSSPLPSRDNKSKQTKYIDIKSSFMEVKQMDHEQFLILDSIVKKAREFFDYGLAEVGGTKVIESHFGGVTASSLNLD